MKVNFLDLTFFQEYLFEKTQLAESSVKLYVAAVKQFLTFNPDIESLEDYNNFLIPRVWKKNARHFYAALKRFIDWKIDDKNLKERLINGLVIPKEHDSKTFRRHLEPKDRLRVINNLNSEKHQIIAIIQQMTGLRAGDVLKIKKPQGVVSSVYKDIPVTTLNVLGKGEKRNVVDIYDNVAQDFIWSYISSNINHKDYYFIELGKMRNRTGNVNSESDLVRMNYQWYWKDLKEALVKTGIHRRDFATHDFRRGFARDIWEKFNGDVQILQRALNHSDPKTTMIYLKQSGLQNKEVLRKFQLHLK